MHVGEHGQPRRRADAIERGEPLVEPGPRERAGVGAIGLVEARLEDDAAGHALGEPREMLGDAQVERVVLEHAGAGDEEERVAPEARHASPVARRSRATARRRTLGAPTLAPPPPPR